ncbi:MAG TPA: hypothetical protein ENH29_02795 [Bacteroidetes bacterium]|nr:hypothetical protein [Bacteroidota bacterium]
MKPNFDVRTRLETICFLLILLLTTGVHGCRNSSEPEPVRPDPPQIVAKSPDTALQETGIDAIPEGDGIFFAWHPPRDDRVKWIKIYRRAQNEDKFQFLASVSSRDTSFIDYEIYPEIPYFYYLTTVTRNRVNSAPSDTIHYMLFPKPGGLSNSEGNKPAFSWHYSALPPIGYYLRLEDEQTAERIWLAEITHVYDAVVQVEYNFDGTANQDSLVTSHRYRWRVDVIGMDFFSGAESNWKLLQR